MKKYGAIDIGTNSIRMLIAHVTHGEIVKRSKMLETTRIGENTDRTGKLSCIAMERTIEGLKKFIYHAKKEGLTSLPVIATSAVRDAQNKSDFLFQVKEETGVEIDIISGEREAELGFLGVWKGFYPMDKDILVVDIGGGSTELIIGDQHGIKYSWSLNMGAVRMTEKYIKQDPVSQKDLDLLSTEIKRMLEPTIDTIKRLDVEKMVGIGGTATTLAAVAQGLNIYEAEKVHKYNLHHEVILEILKLFIEAEWIERKVIPGLQPERADIIIAGTKILYEIMASLSLENIMISDYDNLEGLIFEQM